jgi:hypothetical protein
MLLEGCDDEQDPVIGVEGLGEPLPGLLGCVVHVQVLLGKELCYFLEFTLGPEMEFLDIN